MEPTVTVVIPTRDRPDRLTRLLRCVRQQSFRDFECLVVDDRSRPETLAHYQGIWRDLDERFVLHTNPMSTRGGGGPGTARNTGIRLGAKHDSEIWTQTYFGVNGICRLFASTEMARNDMDARPIAARSV
jgi:glycosyltransferase involved in cell wall biosynthesis